MRNFEQIIALMHGNGPGSSSLEQHVSAMRMDVTYAWTFNQVNYAIRDARPLAEL